MRCPKCDQLPTSVLKTERPIDEKLDNLKRRRRVCRNCRHLFHTYEIPESEFRQLYPKDIELSMEDRQRTPLKSKNKDKPKD